MGESRSVNAGLLGYRFEAKIQEQDMRDRCKSDGEIPACAGFPFEPSDDSEKVRESKPDGVENQTRERALLGQCLPRMEANLAR